MNKVIERQNELDKDASLTEILDAQGLPCPLPLLRTKQRLKQMAVGQHLKVLATDEGAWRDIPVFCELAGHRVLERKEVSGVFEFLIEKAK